MEEIKFGMKVRDRITGFEGTVAGIYLAPNTCRQIQIQPRVDKDGKLPPPAYSDEPDVEIIAPADSQD